MITQTAKTAVAWSLMYAGAFLLGERKAEAFSSLTSRTETSLKKGLGDDLTMTLTTETSTQAQTPDAFDTFVEMRTGLGSGGGAADCVFWTGEGTLFHSPSGRILARFEGIDVARAVRLGPDHVQQLSRKVFWFRDPVTGERMTEFEGKPVRPIKYDAQVFQYARGEADENDPVLTKILPSVERGPRIVPVQPCTPRWASPDRTQMMYNIPIFIDIEIPGRGRYQAYEFYDYTVEPSFPSDRPPSAVWSRQGSIQPFATDGKGVMHTVSRRVTSFDDLPVSIREVIEKEFPLFLQPPANMAEVDHIQAMERKHLSEL